MGLASNVTVRLSNATLIGVFSQWKGSRKIGSPGTLPVDFLSS
ncbi:MAG TPA: hypothetical protein VIP05_14480 [Burkholderiaceae bacterium]